MTTEKLWTQFLETDENGKPKGLSRPLEGISRRAFLSALGYTAGAAALMSCRVPEQEIIPYLRQPPELTPGVASWYASTCSGCTASCGTLVKVRDGRPIKIEGNPEHPVSKGGLCTIAHSLVFGLFDPERLKTPMSGGKESAWKDVDKEIIQNLGALKESGGKLRLLSNSIISPTSKALIDKFLAGFGDAKHVVYEAVSYSAIKTAHGRSHGLETIPAIHFDKASVVVGFEADFLGTWISPVQYTRGYSKARDLKDGSKTMLKHIQFESRMSLTGANADERHAAAPAEQTAALLQLLRALSADEAEPANLPAGKLSPGLAESIDKTAKELLKHKGESIVVSGSSDPDVQHVVNAINAALGNYGKTFDLNSPALQSQDSPNGFEELLGEIRNGEVAALLILDVNPAFDSPSAGAFAEGLKKVPLKVSFSSALDETTSLADYVCPSNHPLESWGDAEAAKGVISLCQPTLAPLFKTRQYQESLLRWSGVDRTFYDELRRNWQENYFAKQSSQTDFNGFWDKSLHDGVFIPDSTGDDSKPAATPTGGLTEAVARLSSQKQEGLALVLYEKLSIRDGRYANSPWLQEMPDPISKVSWDNYASISAATAERLNVAEGQVISIKKGGTSIEAPVLIQPGQADECLAVAVGYGRTKAGKAGNGVGVNAYPLIGIKNGAPLYQVDGVSATATANRVAFAKMQIEPSAHERPLIEEFSIAKYANGGVKLHETDFEKLFAEHDYPDHKWGMAIDLSACTGCNACVLSCQAENNIPVVGKDEVALQRDMHWIRIDRYYEDTPKGTKTRFQPVPCMHCENASCEMVCPVLATVHSTEGLNMQVYNRCVGTRYCANNCAYKVRRFNWFEYPHDDPTANLALNPDVTVRSRGVMEKCTMCVQRIEEKKVLARNEGRAIKDGEIQTACQQSCPADAIVFGDMKDLKSRVMEQKNSGRNYLLLEDLNTKPAVSYLAKITNSEDSKEEH